MASLGRGAFTMISCEQVKDGAFSVCVCVCVCVCVSLSLSLSPRQGPEASPSPSQAQLASLGYVSLQYNPGGDRAIAIPNTPCEVSTVRYM